MDENRLPLIGLTGGIASGKSTVSKYLRQQGFHVIDADKLGHRVLEPGQASYEQIIEYFGKKILNSDSTINRRALGNIVFNDPAQLQILNRISHPLIRSMILQEIEKFASHSRGGLVFLEAAILLEGKNLPACQQIWVVETKADHAITRLQNRNQFSKKEAEARLKSQINNETRRKFADVLIENNGSHRELILQVDAALDRMKL
ncbi:MAG: dephospho-CoA kinase [SAR324 cluster bacterium]|nr:dephospho-CoA kinase [SAR324 cluster bacterium]